MNKDISIIDKNRIPNHNLLVGGFPCQDYSVVNHSAEGIDGKKGVLWWQIYEIIKKKNPPFILLENVDRLIKFPRRQKGRDFGIILACLNSLGYGVEWRVINAADYGFVQRRRRTFIFAFKNSTNYYNNINKTPYEDIINKTGFFVKEFPIKMNNTFNLFSLNYTDNFIYKDLYEVSSCFSKDFKNTGVMINNKICTFNVIPNYKGKYTVLGDILETNVDAKYYKVDYNKGKEVKSAINKLRKKGTPFEYRFKAGTMPYPDHLDKPSRTILTDEGTINRTSHLIEDPEAGKIRILTPIEVERLDGFPDNWTDTGMPERFRYFCMGNALVVGLITKMGNRLNEIFNTEE